MKIPLCIEAKLDLCHRIETQSVRRAPSAAHPVPRICGPAKLRRPRVIQQVVRNNSVFRLNWCDDLCCFRDHRSFIPRNHSRQRTGKMAESRMGDEEACLDLKLKRKI